MSHQRSLSSGTEHHEVQIRGVLACNDNSVLRSAAIAGMGITFIPAIICADDVRAGRLSRVLPAFASEVDPIYAVYPSAQLLTPKVRAFIDFMSESLALSP